MSTQTNELLTIPAEKLRDIMLEQFRQGYAVGYSSGRTSEMTNKPWDTAVPWEKERRHVT